MLDFLRLSDKKESTPDEKQPKFDTAIHEVEQLSLMAKEYSQVEQVAEHGRFLNLGSHKVTGKELNTVTAHIDDSFIQTKNVQKETLQHIVQLYRALDALDADHIAGILTAIRAAETATDWARINDENIGKITNYLLQDDRIQAYKKEQDDRMATLETKIKTAYIVAGSAIAIAFVSLVLCFVA